ncbi:isoprenylcysteine carboxylmethyltransferase ste14 [Brevipalpus obovatus]|uniref:isoprenylcysteine carboxylmethyltransferase ste14 n=1 Tax=Brevipalpus obovatus TaxID=246614 RepID=UPI003D9FA862
MCDITLNQRNSNSASNFQPATSEPETDNNDGQSSISFYGIFWRSCLLVSTFGSSFAVLLLVDSIWRPLLAFFMIVSFFHFSEFFVTALSKPRSLGSDLFLLNHSPAYNFALLIAIIEFVIEVKWFPYLKLYPSISLLGVLICIAGESVRKTAILTARSNFDHRLKTHKEKGHVLVTHGIYSWSRHPAYVGWFYWAIGTQVLLLNPVSLIFYAISSWKFFDERVDFEESLLIRFFGQEYRNYQKKVPTRLPFVKGSLITTGHNF